MNTFDGILLCTDLDGTLLRKDKTISPENLRAIEHFKSHGGLFTFVTGRMPYSASEIIRILSPNAPIGCINGGGLYDHRAGTYIWKQAISPDVLDMVEAADRALPDIGIQVNTFDGIWFSKENPAMELFRKVTGDPNLVRHYREIDEPMAKIVFGDTNEDGLLRLIELLHAHPLAHNFDFVRSEKILYEIMPKGIHKGKAIEKLAEHLRIDPRRTIAVGDYNNDVGMLREAGIGIAVANASEEAKAAADLITVSNEEHAIARVISDIENGKLAF